MTLSRNNYNCNIFRYLDDDLGIDSATVAEALTLPKVADRRIGAFRALNLIGL